MSYADATSKNISPNVQQPLPDKNLLVTEEHSHSPVNDSIKVNVASSSFKSNPHTTTSDASVIPQYDTSKDDSSPLSKSKKQKAKKQLDRAEQEGIYLWSRVREQIMRPGIAGGLIGVVNVGLLMSVGYSFYSRPEYRSDTKIIGGTVVGALVLLGSEGYAAEAYRNTDAGRAEEERAREEGAAIYRHTKEVVLRPGVLGGLAGILNVGILSTVGFFAYQHWDMPRWDRRVVSAVTAGLIALSAGEGYLGEQYKEKEYPKRK